MDKAYIRVSCQVIILFKFKGDFMCAYTLYPIQEQIVERLKKMKCAVIAPQTGIGKSICVLHLAKYLQNTENVKTIFCIPKSARASFEKEMKYKLEEDYLMINTDNPLKDLTLLKDYKFIFIEFSVLGNYVDSLVQLTKEYSSYIFIDEAHALCSPKSAQTTYMRLIRNNCIGCYSITASPIMTSIDGLFYLYSFTFPTLGIFKSWFKFRNQFCITQDRTIRMMGKKRIIKEIVGYKNMETLYDLLDKITIKEAIDYDVDYQFLKTDLDQDRVDQYKLAAKGILISDEEKEWGPRLHDLQRVVDGLPQNDEDIKEYNKVKLLISSLKEIMNRNEATLIYVEYTDTISYLKEILGRHKEDIGFNSIMVISGQEKEEKRQKIEQSIIPKDIVIITSAGKQSRNLQRANNLIFYNIPYSLGNVLQCSGRICRVDTKFKKQHFYILEVDHTIDTYRIALFKDHLSLLDRLLGKKCRGTLTCDYVEIDRMKMKELKKSLLWRTK